VADDLLSRLRPVTREEWGPFRAAMAAAFGGTPTAPYLTDAPPVAEMDRSLGLFDGELVLATSGIFSRTLTVPGGLVPCAAVTWVTVAPTVRRRGVLTEMMRRQLTGLHEQQREPVAALWASEFGIYGRFGYAPAAFRGGLVGRSERLQLRSDVDLGTGTVRLVDRETYQPAATALHDAVRRSVPGNLDRDQRWWDRQLLDLPDSRDGATALRFLLHTETDGTVTGYAAWRMKGTWDDDRGEPDGVLHVEEVRASSTQAYASLWKVLLSVDLVRTVKVPMASPDDPLRHMITDGRALATRPVDSLWVRLVDVDRALAARRYPAPIDLVLEVRDAFCPWNSGRWRLTGHPAGGHCARTDRDPDLILGIEELSAVYLGGVSLAALQAAGRVTEVSPGAVTLASTSFRWPVTPWCPDMF
jgi:predicted acetyltransferase